MSTRLEEIRALVDLAPGDPFPLYGLAMEYRAQGDADAARRTFERLAERFPAYVPQYLLHAKLLIELGQPKTRAAARQVLTVGIEKARAAKNSHALGELQAELAGLEGLDDDE
jgi:hypothetical protein